MKNSQLIKKNKVASGYTKIYPLAYIQGIYDYDTGEKLETILKAVNHIYLPYNGTEKDTRRTIPVNYRRKGITITYKVGNKLTTEIYKGNDNNIDNDAIFTSDSNWEIIPDLEFVKTNASKIPYGAIIPEHLSPSLWELLSETHTITNFPDDEDLTQKGQVIKFKDRDNLFGKGYKILRNNWVDGNNILDVSEFSSENTIYELRYYFDLNGKELILPQNSSLLFNGGKINNGKIVCNNTNILGVNKFEDTGNAEYSGTFEKGLIMNINNSIKWFNGTNWISIESGGTGSSNINSATVIAVHQADVADADVELVDNELQFSFVLPKGIKGDTGAQGPIGPMGPQGPQGPAGDVAISTQTFIVFKSSGNSLETPASPIGGHWNSINNTFTTPEGWSRNDELGGLVWMSSGIFRADTGELVDNWSTPVRITGQDGSNGADGTNVEFIYKLTINADISNPPTLNVNDSPNTNGYTPSGWTASPTGISPTYKCEWFSSRKKDNNGTWTSWSNPSPWSVWSVDGRDGDGVEYIYFRNNGASVDNPTPDDTTTDEYQEKGDYAGKEYVPSGWSNNPVGVNASNKYEWVSVRKYKDGLWGPFSTPAVWSKWSIDGTNGTNGTDGLSIRTMYAKYTLGSTPTVTDNINPGSVWGLVFPTYNTETEAVWVIQAYVNSKGELASEAEGATYVGWQGPWIISGIPGKSGIAPNYKVYVYKKASSKPNAPTSSSPNFNGEDGWYNYPNSEGQWWQCIGSVDGSTNLVTSWSEVLIVNGRDGTAQDGKFTEFRFALGTYDSSPSLSNATRIPSGWSLTPPSVTGSNVLYMTKATINPDDTLFENWCSPVRLSGEKGPQGNTGPIGPTGPTGSQGLSGIHGVDILTMYCLGTETTYTGNSNPTGNSPTGWSTSIPTVNSSNPYIWCIQGKRTYSSSSDNEGTVSWSTPFRLSGINGLNGTQGKRGQLIYPAGIYDVNVTYTTDSNKAPYVLDTLDGNFYVLNSEMSWKGIEQNSTINYPSKEYAVNNGKYWVKFDAFEAIYAKIGIIANGLIGSAVFNGDYMFSQQGIDEDGNLTSEYQYFNTEDPYSINNEFRPSICINFKTGEAWFAAGKTYFAADGSGYLANNQISWNSTGDLKLPASGTVEAKFTSITNATNSIYDYKFSISSNLPDVGEVKLVASSDKDRTDIINEIILSDVSVPTSNVGTITAVGAKYLSLLFNDKVIAVEDLDNSVSIHTIELAKEIVDEFTLSLEVPNNIVVEKVQEEDDEIDTIITYKSLSVGYPAEIVISDLTFGGTMLAECPYGGGFLNDDGITIAESKTFDVVAGVTTKVKVAIAKSAANTNGSAFVFRLSE